jgi:3-dehydroquinate synthase
MTYPAHKWQSLLETMQRDKKSRAGNLRFIVLDAIGKPTVLTAPTNEMLFTAYQEIAEH